MVRQIHVNGEANVKISTVGVLQDLGVSVDGVDIAINDYTDPVHTDTYGPHVPFDEQQFLQDAHISMQLVFYDEEVLALIRSRMAGSDGTLGAAGNLWGAGGYYFRLLIESPVDALPYNFPKARLIGAQSQKVGTKRTIWNLRFYAVPYSGQAGTTFGVVLYNQVTF